MASAPDNRSKIEQIVVEFFAKSLHIILESRIPSLCSAGTDGESCLAGSSSSSSGPPKSRDRWFNLALGDCTSALQNFEPWRRNFSDPMIVDILLDSQQRSMKKQNLSENRGWDKEPSSSSQGKVQEQGASRGQEDDDGGTVLERWTVQFEPRKKGISSSSKGEYTIGSSGTPDKRRLTNIGPLQDNVKEITWSEVRSSRPGSGAIAIPTHVSEVPAVYKRTVVMLRSLYCRCRLLPAYRLFRLLSSPSNCCNFSLNYRVLSSTSSSLSTMSLNPEHENQDILSFYSFTPVETLYGRMCLSVMYRKTTSVIALEVVPSILPRIIPDYVGSPTTDPLKKFTGGDPQSLPLSYGMPINRGIHMVSVPSSLHNSPPPDLILGRRHSWSGRVNQIQPALLPPSSPSYRISRSPSPSASPSHPFQPSSSTSPYRVSPYSPFSGSKHNLSELSVSPLCSPLSSAGHKSGTQPIRIDRASPPFSPSPSPSPPTYAYPGSAPVSIPKSSHSQATRLLTGDTHHRSRNMLPPLSPGGARKTEALLRSSSGSPRYSGQGQPHTSQSRSFESSMQMMHEDSSQQQAWRSDSNQPVFSTENLVADLSSKAVLGDDGDDEDFSCPFAVDDMDIEENISSSRSRPHGAKGGASFASTTSGSLHDAAVGALIRVFKSAQPLRHSARANVPVGFEPTKSSQEVRGVSVVESFRPLVKTAADALEELQLYRKTRDIICMNKEERGG